jgi:hypothetical protein
MILRGHARKHTGVPILDVVDQTVHILSQQLGITDQRRGAPVFAARNRIARLTLKMPRVIRQLSDISGAAAVSGPSRNL